jgi:hypothetical protein
VEDHVFRQLCHFELSFDELIAALFVFNEFFGIRFTIVFLEQRREGHLGNRSKRVLLFEKWHSGEVNREHEEFDRLLH